MGTSIRSLIECKNNEDGHWKAIEWEVIEDNYRLFSILANVRNWDDIKPISQPRGLPDDLDPERKRIPGDLDHTPMNSREHVTYFNKISCSYYTLKDIKEYEIGRASCRERV